MVNTKRLGTPKPKLQEISFSGNMPPRYEKRLQAELKKSERKIKKIKIEKIRL